MTTYDTIDPARITGRAEFAAGLTTLREHAGLTVRGLAGLLGVSASTVGGYLSGRHLPTAGQAHVLRNLLAACGITDEGVVQAWVEALGRVRTSTDRRLPRPPAPYRGLESFEPGDAALFFGREDETNAILQRLRALAQDPGPSGGMLAVIGPSGSGKSSVLRAGVVAAIECGELGEGWTSALAVPGADPLNAIAGAAAPATPADPGGARHVIVFDQFEELFTSVPDPGDRADFLHALAARPASTLVVLGMRADFYAAAAAEPLLLAALQHAQVLIGPMSTERVRDAVLRPAEAAGGTVEDGLVDLVLADLAPHDAGHAHDPGGLPLLSHALLAAWVRGSGARLTIADYLAAGGIDGAVQRTAEDLYSSLSPEGRELARRMFLRLVHLDDDVAVTRRRAARDELARLAPAGDDSAEVMVDAFVERRLLTAYATSVEISHEALLTAWPRLREWVDTDRAGLRLHRQITEGATAWDDAGRDPAALPRGTLLATGSDWAADTDHHAELDHLEVAYLSAAAALRDAERRTERRRTMRLRRLLVAVAALAVVATVLAVLALRANSAARSENVAARHARDDALSGQVASEARQLLPSDPALAEQLALVAFDRGDKDLGTLLDLSSRPPVTRVLGVQGPTALAVSPDGTLIAVGHSDDGSLHLYRKGAAAEPAAVGVIPGDRQRDQQFALTFLPDGRTLVSAGEGRSIKLWNVARPDHPTLLAAVPDSFTGAVQSLAVTPDGRTLAAGSTGSAPLQEWETTDPAQPRPLRSPRGLPAGADVRAVAFSPDGSALAAAGTAASGFVARWAGARPASAAPVVQVSEHGVYSFAYAPDGKLVFDGDQAGMVHLLDPRTLRPRRLPLQGVSTSNVNAIAVSADGTKLAAGFSDNTTREWSTDDWSVIGNSGNPGPVTGVRYSPDGSTLLTTAADGTLRLFPALTGFPTPGTAFNLSYSADSRRLAIFHAAPDAGAQVWDTSRPADPRRLGSAVTYPTAAGTGALSPDGRSLVVGSVTGSIAVYSLDRSGVAHSRGLLFQALEPKNIVEGVAYSPDGHLVFVGGDDSTVRIVDVRDPAAPRLIGTVRTGGAVFSIAVSPNGRLLAAASADKAGYLWDISHPSAPRRLARLGGFTTYAYAVAFNPSATLLAVGSADHSVRVWNIKTPSRPYAAGKPLIGSTDYIYALSFAPDGASLASASGDGSVRLYPVTPHVVSTPTSTLSSLGGTAFSVLFRPDGASLIAGGRSASVTQWSLDPRRFVAQLCPLVGDRLTRAEWALYVPGAKYDPPCR